LDASGVKVDLRVQVLEIFAVDLGVVQVLNGMLKEKQLSRLNTGLVKTAWYVAFGWLKDDHSPGR